MNSDNVHVLVVSILDIMSGVIGLISLGFYLPKFSRKYLMWRIGRMAKIDDTTRSRDNDLRRL